MSILSKAQIESFQRDGYILLENIIPGETLRKLSGEFDQWNEESRAHNKPYGTTYDNRPRFDIEP
ncbi:MAG: phytanoyl-CoA dioxygenase family protein, partial [Gammaproteobacteria bacterium]|nr:phytanoyl-CoA dioxygenase family protein [Gammaproteobacteria bacterium]